MFEHQLKSWPEFFGPIIDGTKRFDLRRNDRNFKVGDRLRFQEWEPDTKSYSGRECERTVVYVLAALGPGCVEPLRGLVSGYCIVGFQ